MHEPTPVDRDTLSQSFPTNISTSKRDQSITIDRLLETHKDLCPRVHVHVPTDDLCSLPYHCHTGNHLHHHAPRAIHFSLICLHLLPLLQECKQATTLEENLLERIDDIGLRLFRHVPHNFPDPGVCWHHI